MTKKTLMTLEWLVQVAVTYAVGLWLLGPIWRLTFQAADFVLGDLATAVLVLLTLVPFWAVQAAGLAALSPSVSRPWRWLMLLGAYLAGIGPLFAIAAALTRRWPVRFLPPWVQTALEAALGIPLLFFATYLYSALVALIVLPFIFP